MNRVEAEVLKPARLNGRDVDPGEIVEIEESLSRAWFAKGLAQPHKRQQAPELPTGGSTTGMAAPDDPAANKDALPEGDPASANGGNSEGPNAAGDPVKDKVSPDDKKAGGNDGSKKGDSANG